MTTIVTHLLGLKHPLACVSASAQYQLCVRVSTTVKPSSNVNCMLAIHDIEAYFLNFSYCYLVLTFGLTL